MRLTNILLTILICLVAFQKLPLKEEKTVSKKEEMPTVKIGKTYNETKTVKVTSNNNENVKHSTSFRNYVDTMGNSNQRISHNIRVGKEFYISGGIYTRQSEYRDSAGMDVSITKYW